MTLPELAEKADLSVSGLNKWLSGTSAPRANNLRRAAEALGVTVGWLMGEGDDALPQQLGPAPAAPVAAPEPQPAPAPVGPLRLYGTVKTDWLEDAFRSALEQGGLDPDQLGDTFAIMALTLLLYDARAQKAQAERDRISAEAEKVRTHEKARD